MPQDDFLKNFINLRIHRIAVDRCDLELVDSIKEAILKELEITNYRLTSILNNTVPATPSELIAIAHVLNKYRPTSKADLLEPCAKDKKETPHQPAAHE
ncbi:MAG: hypothetical protein EOP53_13165 [Sphingobacteriales bacterium]|nr:MAG: hypothetical protein EOP53_13165 [Sphingobacteriales bacterium]